MQGHSWGSFLGLELCRRHPDWLHAYVGVGQVTDAPESERRGWQFAIQAARDESNAQAVHELEAIAPYAAAAGAAILIKDLYVQRKWVGYYGGVMAYRRDNNADSDLARLSPDYSDDEIRHIWDGNHFLPEPYLLPELLSVDTGAAKKFEVPIVLFSKGATT